MLAYTQTFNASCGAACLLCAACELHSVKKVPVRPNWQPMWTQEEDLQLTWGMEKRIYSVTSGLNGQVPTDNTAGYSLPSCIFECADALNLSAKAYVPPSSVGLLLKMLYRDDVGRARRLGLQISDHAAHTPRHPRQILLRLLRFGDPESYGPRTGLHWVMERSDGTIMDPLSGRNFASFNLCKGWMKSHQYRGEYTAYSSTGIGIRVEPKLYSMESADDVVNLFS